MSKFTQGPWEIHRSGMDRPYEISHGKERRLVITWGGIARPASAEAEANARLIAAAPDLLEALESLLAVVDQYDLPLSDPERIAARAAISRARGES